MNAEAFQGRKEAPWANLPQKVRALRTKCIKEGQADERLRDMRQEDLSNIWIALEQHRKQMPLSTS